MIIFLNIFVINKKYQSNCAIKSSLSTIKVAIHQANKKNDFQNINYILKLLPYT